MKPMADLSSSVTKGYLIGHADPENCPRDAGINYRPIFHATSRPGLRALVSGDVRYRIN